MGDEFFGEVDDVDRPTAGEIACLGVALKRLPKEGVAPKVLEKVPGDIPVGLGKLLYRVERCVIEELNLDPPSRRRHSVHGARAPRLRLLPAHRGTGRVVDALARELIPREIIEKAVPLHHLIEAARSHHDDLSSALPADIDLTAGVLKKSTDEGGQRLARLRAREHVEWLTERSETHRVLGHDSHSTTMRTTFRTVPRLAPTLLPRPGHPQSTIRCRALSLMTGSSSSAFMRVRRPSYPRAMGLCVCLFCFKDRTPTLEHLISRPISDALGLDRRSPIAEASVPVSGSADPSSLRMVSLETMKVRAVCAGCNNGWMSSLECETGHALASWIHTGVLPNSGGETLRRWLATRLLIWSVRDGGGGRLPDLLEKGDAACIPHFDRAKRLARSAPDALEGLACGVGLAEGQPAYGFGNASTKPVGRALPFTAVLALRLPPLQLWVADSVIGGQFRLPRELSPIVDGQDLGRLSGEGRGLSPKRVEVRFPPGLDEAAAALLSLSDNP